MFSYKIVSEQEEMSLRYSLLEPGIYDFVVKNALFKYSKSSGNPMIELTLDVFDKTGNIHSIFDYLVDTDSQQWKTKHFCVATCLQHEYQNKKFNETLVVGKQGKVKIIIQKGKENGNGGFYPDKNSVADYLPDIEEIKEQNSSKFDDDIIPFS